MKYKTIYKSVIGPLTLISDGQYLTNIIFPEEPYYQNIKNKAVLNDNLKIFSQTKTWLDSYFKHQKPDINTLKIKLEGTTFQRSIWNILKTIPDGQIVTYGDIAKTIKSNAYRAIGKAISYNPIPIIIPCHRVIGTNHNLTGYSGGLTNKIYLLKLEGHNIEKFNMPKRRK